MRTMRMLAACLLAFAVFGCVPGGQPAAPPAVPSATTETEPDYAVWSALLAAEYPPGTGVQAILLADHADTAEADAVASPSDYLRQRLLGLRQDTWHDYQRRHATARALQAERFDTSAIGAPLRLLSDAELAEIFANGGWQELHARFPRSSGIVSVSLPGYAADGSQALVHVSRTMGPLAGSGRLVLLQREGASWRIGGWAMTWIS